VNAREQRRVVGAQAGGEVVGAGADGADCDRGAVQLQERERAAAGAPPPALLVAATIVPPVACAMRSARCWRTCSATSSIASTGISRRARAGSR
jgi:hypothetical protein